jgi:hypothetical protein
MITIRLQYVVLVGLLAGGQAWSCDDGVEPWGGGIVAVDDVRTSPQELEQRRDRSITEKKDREKLAQAITSSVSQCVQSVVLLQQMGDGKTPEAVAQESGKMTEALGNMIYAFYTHGKLARGHGVESVAQLCAHEIIAVFTEQQQGESA